MEKLTQKWQQATAAIKLAWLKLRYKTLRMCGWLIQDFLEMPGIRSMNPWGRLHQWLGDKAESLFERGDHGRARYTAFQNDLEWDRIYSSELHEDTPVEDTTEEPDWRQVEPYVSIEPKPKKKAAKKKAKKTAKKAKKKSTKKPTKKTTKKAKKK